jgi:hypothetical protein
MNFLISDTFTDSLARLTGDEQKAAKTTAFDLQMNPANPGMSFHQLERARDKNFWSVRVSGDLRLIVHRSEGSLLLCYVAHHDKAYEWAERRKIQEHPTTGAAQILEIRETVKEIIVPRYVEEAPRPKESPKPKKLFGSVTDDELLSFGVPPEWLKDVRDATEDTILAVAEHLPAEASEAVLELATGGQPRKPGPKKSTETSFEHPDAKRRFKVVTSAADLQQALEYPWEKWTVFLHPDQRNLVERDYSGPVRVSGSAGTGKTIVALHRAVYLARKNPTARVLLATFSDTLAHALQNKLQRLLVGEPRLGERIEVASVEDVGLRLYRAHVGPLKLVDDETVNRLIEESAKSIPSHKFSATFLSAEWAQVVDTWQLKTWESYRDVVRLGRRSRLNEERRKVLWEIFSRVIGQLEIQKSKTPAAMFTDLGERLKRAKHPPFDFVVVDEAQDIDAGQLKMMAAIGANRPNSLFFTGDVGQRIFQQPFSWKSVGIDLRGKSKTLRVNYRTSHQIRTYADKLLEPEITDADGISESRDDTISVFSGVAPKISICDTEAKEVASVAGWVSEQLKAGLQPQEFAIFVRSDAQLARAESAAKAAAVPHKVLDKRVETSSTKLSICTMHLAKGLEFRAVAVMACDEEVLPLRDRIEAIGDTGDLQEVYDTERSLLYVACTRARDHLLISAITPGSEFLGDLIH